MGTAGQDAQSCNVQNTRYDIKTLLQILQQNIYIFKIREWRFYLVAIDGRVKEGFGRNKIMKNLGKVEK